MGNENKEEALTIPYIVFESDRARAERIIKRLIGVVAVLSCGLIALTANTFKRLK